MTRWVKKRLTMLCLLCGTSMLALGCDATGVLTDATAVQLETSLISLMNTAVSYIIFNLFKLPLTNLFT